MSAPGRIMTGVNPSGSPALVDFQSFNGLIGRNTDYLMFFQSFPAEPVLYSAYFTFCTTLGALAISTWQPMGATIVADINAGTYDAYIDGEAATMAADGRNHIIRFAHEGNGNWTNYGPSSCTDAAYISMFRRVVTRFRAAGAKNVQFAWNPNVWTLAGLADPRPRYPGDEYCHWIGLDGYMNLLSGAWSTFSTIHSADAASIQALSPNKLYMVAEQGQGEHDVRGSRIQWYKDALGTTIPSLTPNMRLVNFFHRDLTGVGEGDYRIDLGNGVNDPSAVNIRSLLSYPPYTEVPRVGVAGWRT